MVGPDRLNDQEVARLVKKTALAAGVHGGVSGDRPGTEVRGPLAASWPCLLGRSRRAYVQKQLGHASAEMTRSTSAGAIGSAST